MSISELELNNLVTWAATDFVTRYGNKFPGSTNPQGQTELMKRILFTFNGQFHDIWDSMSPAGKVVTVQRLVAQMLPELFPSLMGALHTPRDRFDRRWELIKLLISFMVLRMGKGSDGTMDYLHDYTMLIYCAHNYSRSYDRQRETDKHYWQWFGAGYFTQHPN